jgi:hypothetical protein
VYKDGELLGFVYPFSRMGFYHDGSDMMMLVFDVRDMCINSINLQVIDQYQFNLYVTMIDDENVTIL